MIIFEKLKVYGVALLGALSAIFAVLFYREKAGRESDKREAEQAQKKALLKAQDAQHKARLENNAKIKEKTKQAESGDYQRFFDGD